MRRPVLDFRRCSTCGVELHRGADGCTSCGRYARGLTDVIGTKRGLLATLVPILLAMVVVLLVPTGALGGMATLGAGLAPLMMVAAWLAVRRHTRDANALGPQIERLETRLAALRTDLSATERRLADAKRDVAYAKTERTVQALRREMKQDHRLRMAQRRMVAELRAKVERLRIARIRSELAYAEACRDARLEMPELAADVAARIVSLERSLDGSEMEPEAWRRLLEDLRILHRDLTRGVPRLLAAARLDPLSNAGISDDPEGVEDAQQVSVRTLDGAVDWQLERISRSFDAIEELALDIEPSLVESGARVVRLRVEEDEVASVSDASAARAEVDDEPRLLRIAGGAESSA